MHMTQLLCQYAAASKILATISRRLMTSTAKIPDQDISLQLLTGIPERTHLKIP
jgi:hypothetical protein